MGKVFDMGTPEMTTQEVVSSLSGLNLDRNLTARTRDFFHFAAMVKYAGITPDFPRIYKDHDLVREFIHSTAGKMHDSHHGEPDLVTGIKTGIDMATENSMGRKNTMVHSAGIKDPSSNITKGP